jgi:heptosyltransferase-2
VTRPIDPAAFARIVIRPPNWLGDAVLALPAMAAVREAFPATHLTIAAPASVAALFGEETAVRPDAVIDLPRSTRDAVTTLARGRFDLGLLLPNSFRSAWQFRRAGIPQRWGYARSWRGPLLTRRARRPPRRPVLHQSDYYRALVRGLGVPAGDGAPWIGTSAASREAAARLLARAGVSPEARIVVFAPGAAYGQAKQWPPARAAEVASRLVRESDVTCVLVGAAHDRDAGRAIESWLRAHAPDTRARVVDLIGQTSLRALFGVTARAAAFVSNDSGAMHVAAAVGRPVVAIFGPTDERATRPIGDAAEVLTAPAFCRPCLLRDCPIDHRCMKRIAPDRVFDAVRRHLAGTA